MRHSSRRSGDTMPKLPLCIAVATLAAITAICVRSKAQAGEKTMPCNKQEVRYRPSGSSFDDKIILAETNDPTVLHSAETRSPQGTRYLMLTNPDFNKPGPWSTTVLIGGVGIQGRLLKLSFIDHASGGVSVQWLNEKLVFVEVWWGRIASTDLIFDVNSKTFLYKETAEYGDLMQPCH